MKKNLLYLFFLIGLLCLLPELSQAQTCSAPTSISAANIKNASCPGNGAILAGMPSPDSASIYPDYYVYALLNSTGTTVIAPYQTSRLFNSILAGSYQIRARRVCVATLDSSAFISQNATVANTEVFPNISSITLNRASRTTCPTGRFTVNATGTAPLQYALVPALSTPEPVASYVRPPQSSRIFDSLPPGTYYVRVYNACFPNAVTRSVVVPAISSVPSFSSSEFRLMGCDNFELGLVIRNHFSVFGTSDPSKVRLWVEWPNSTVDTIPLSTSFGSSPAPTTGVSQTFNLSKLDPAYIPSYRFWEGISTWPVVIKYYYRDICGVVVSDSLKIQEPESINLEAFTYGSQCSTMDAAFRIRYDRLASPTQTLYNYFNSSDAVTYSIDGGTTWQSGGVPFVTREINSRAITLPRDTTTLMVVFCGDTFSTVLVPNALPAITPTFNSSNEASCLGKSGIYIAGGILNSDSLGIEMLTAPAGQSIVPYFNFRQIPGGVPPQLANLVPGTYTFKLYDTLGVVCPRTINVSYTLTDPFTLNYTYNISCSGELEVNTTSQVVQSNGVPTAISSRFRVQILDEDGDVVLGGPNGYIGNPSGSTTTVSIPGDSINALPFGSYTIRAFKKASALPSLITDTCTIVDKPFERVDYGVVNLNRSRFYGGCTGTTNPGVIVAVAELGIPPYTFTLFDGATVISPETPGGTIYTSLDLGKVYNLQVIDSCGTVVNRSMSLNAQPRTSAIGYTTMPCETDDVTLAVPTLPGISYQWYQDSVAIPGATTSQYFLPSITLADSGSYLVEYQIGSCLTRTVEFNLNPLLCLSILPVELISFNVKNDNGNARLEWVTASEFNNERFEIERSTNAVNWVKIGSVVGNGTSSEVNKYTFMDESPNLGGNYYRLRQVDFDANFEYSEIVYLHISSTQQEVIVYPVPANNEVFLSNINRFSTIKIFDSSGKLVQIKGVNGEDTLKFDTQLLLNGLYLIMFESKDGSFETKRMIKN